MKKEQKQIQRGVVNQVELFYPPYKITTECYCQGLQLAVVCDYNVVITEFYHSNSVVVIDQEVKA